MNRLKELRLSKGLNQKDAAKILGIAQPTLSGWETGRTQIDYDNLIKVADYYKVTLDYLLGRTVRFTELKDLDENTNKKIPIVSDVRVTPRGLELIYTGQYELGGDEYDVGEYIAFCCPDDRLLNLGIKKGDTVIVKRQEAVESGDIALIVYQGKFAMFQKVTNFNGGMLLESANEEYESIILTGGHRNDAYIIGKVVEYRRKL